MVNITPSSTDHKTRVLIIDDESQIIRVLTPVIQVENYDVRSASDGEGGLEIISAWNPDIILLDLGLPDLDGKEIIRRVRDWSDVPIIVLSARTFENEKIAALDLGANDYIDKPFSSGELLARMRAALRNLHRRANRQPIWSGGCLSIDFGRRLVTTHGIPQHLTPKEYDLLRVFVQHADRALTHRQLVKLVWDEGEVRDAQVLRVLVSQLRQKIEDDPAHPKFIRTESGFGYRFCSEPGGMAETGAA